MSMCVCVCVQPRWFFATNCVKVVCLCATAENFFLPREEDLSLSLSLSLPFFFLFFFLFLSPFFFWIKELVVCRMDMALVSFLKKTAEEQVPGQRVVTPNLPPAVTTTWEEEGSRGNWRRRSSKATTFRMNVEQELRRRILFAKGEELGVV
jgi:hypothetical protein